MTLQFDAAMQSFGIIQKQFGPMLDGLLLLFFRLLAFTNTGPIFNRKNIPMMIKISMALFLTGAMAGAVTPDPHGPLSPAGQYPPFLILLAMNIVIGALIGFIADMILQPIYSAGSTMNNQIGLSSANMLDPSSNRQSMLLEVLFSMLTAQIFIAIGGLHWMIAALRRSLSIFPLYAFQQPVVKVINPAYLVDLSGNVLIMGVQLVAPIVIITLVVDIILGIVNRTAQQMPVFQLSFALKPAIGIAVMLATLTPFLQSIMRYLSEHSSIF